MATKKIRGADISSIQKVNDWNAVKKSGIEVVILRCHQKFGIDSSFESHYAGAKKAGIKVGVYKYSYAMSVKEAEKEATDVLAVLKGKKLDYPVFYDVEEKAQRSLSKATMAQIIKAFMGKISAAGFKVGIYCNVDWYTNVLDRSLLPNYDYWLAAYPYNDNGTVQERLNPNAGMGWQYSSKGNVPGINGNVDLNLFYKDYTSADKNTTTPAKEEKSDSDKYAAVVEKAVQWMEKTAANPAHGYDQIYRWGERGDYDCSSAVITAYQQAGIPVKSNGATYTGNMYTVFTKCGFVDVTSKVNLQTGAGMKRGDVLLNHVHHVAMHCGNGMEVEASINEFGGATGGRPGDQTGAEFLKKAYRNYPWNCVLRLGNGAASKTEVFKATGTAVANVDDLYVRATPSGVVLGQLKKGNRVEIDGKTSGAWTHVNVSGIGIGYCYTEYLTCDNQKTPAATTPATTISKKQNKDERMFVGKVTCDVLNVRTWAGTEFPMIQGHPQLHKDNLVDVMNFTQTASDGNKWYFVRIENGVDKKGKKKYVFGFVSKEYIKKM